MNNMARDNWWGFRDEAIRYIQNNNKLLQKAALLGTARLLRRVPEAWGYET